MICYVVIIAIVTITITIMLLSILSLLMLLLLLLLLGQTNDGPLNRVPLKSPYAVLYNTTQYSTILKILLLYYAIVIYHSVSTVFTPLLCPGRLGARAGPCPRADSATITIVYLTFIFISIFI